MRHLLQGKAVLQSLEPTGFDAAAFSARMNGTLVASSTDAADATAVARCAAGDPAALEGLYKSHARSCLCLARSVLVDTHHAEDAVQEAYLDLWRHADRFDASRSTVRAWLLMLTHRKAVDRVRMEQRRSTTPLHAEHDRPDDGPGPAMQAVARLLAEEAREAVAALEPVKREALVLAYWGGYTQREIAVLTDTPLGTVKSRMHTALRDLPRLLASREEPASLAADVPARAAR